MPTQHRPRDPRSAAPSAPHRALQAPYSYVRAMLVATVAVIAPLAAGSHVHAQSAPAQTAKSQNMPAQSAPTQNASAAVPTVDPSAVTRINELMSESKRLRETLNELDKDARVQTMRQIEMLEAELARMPDMAWTTWIMPYPPLLSRSPGGPRVGTYIDEAVRRAEGSIPGVGNGAIVMRVSPSLSEIIVIGERWRVALAAEALRDAVNHVWNRAMDLEAVRRAAEIEERAERSSQARAGLIRIDWPGGTLADLVNAIRQVTQPEPVNIVLLDDGASGPIADLHIAPISVRDVTPTVLLRAIAGLEPPGWRLAVTVTGDGSAGPDPKESDEGTAVRAPGAPIITIRARRTSEPAATMPVSAEPYLEVIDLSHYLTRDIDGARAVDGKDRQERLARLMDAIGAAIALEGGASPELRMHESTGLLLVRGTPAQVDPVLRVIKTILKR